MSLHLEAVSELPEFIQLVTLFTNHPLLAMLGGTITTALIQSSSAMIAIVQQMYHLKAISLYVSIPYIFGCNTVQPLPLFSLPLKPILPQRKLLFFISYLTLLEQLFL